MLSFNNEELLPLSVAAYTTVIKRIRNFEVQEDKYKYKMKTLESIFIVPGVTQGLNLGPLLFPVCIIFLSAYNQFVKLLLFGDEDI